MVNSHCLFCTNCDHEIVINRNNLFRIIGSDDKDYPGYLRLVLNHHVKELSDLDVDSHVYIAHCMFKIERIMRDILNPDKINIASIGNKVMHVHYHIIPRFQTDKHFPNTIWGEVVNNNYIPSNTLIEASKQLYTILSQEQL